MMKRHLHIAILGGGFAGVYAAQRAVKRLGHLGLNIGVIAAENHMVFQPMLPEVVGGSLSPRHVVNPIRLICRGAEVLKGTVTNLDLTGKSLTLSGGYFSNAVEVTFDHLVLALGADVDLSRIPGMSEHAFLVRNAGDAMKLRAAIVSRMEEANLLEDMELRRKLLSFVVVGGGYSGVETAGQMQDLIRGVCKFYDNIEPGEASVTLVHSGECLLPMLDEDLGRYTHRVLEKMGVRVLLNQRVRAATARTVLLQDGTRLDTSLVVCTVGNAPHPVIKQLGEAGILPVERGKVRVKSTGLVPGFKDLWAAGDCSAFPKADGGFCPETAQFAMRQGLMIGENLAASHFGQPLDTFTFTGLGELASIGHRKAVAQLMGLNFSGIIAWFMWRTIYLMKLPGLDRKLRVMAEWTFELFFPRDINLLTPQYSSPLEEMHLEPGDPLFEAGEPAFSLYAVKDGCVELTDDHGELIKSCSKGDHFGERALLGDRVWRFNATAKESSTLVAIDSRTFDKLVGSIGSLNRMFTRSAETYHLPEEVDQSVEAISSSLRYGSVRDIMTTGVTTLNADACLQDALAEFQTHPHSTYPVVDAERRVVGLLRRATTYDYLKHHGFDCNPLIRDTGLSKPHYSKPETSIPDLVEDFMRTGATKSLVVDDDMHLLGMVTVFDLLKTEAMTPALRT
ncbi:MAG: FAD-dependent oxidoreductase [Verrucomicrobiaceae bacterium]|nr:FAD-dependent oxidoreductase [Verrucomicrobiaceae bacterium]